MDSSFELHNAILDSYYARTDEEKKQALNQAKAIVQNDPSVLSAKVHISEFMKKKKIHHNTKTKKTKLHPLAVFRFKESFPLIWAAYLGLMDMVQLFLQVHPEACAERADYDRIPLHEATKGGHVQVMKCLLEAYPHGATVCDRLERLPLHYAAGYGHYQVVQVLLDSFPDGAMYQDKLGDTPLHFAINHGHVKCTTELLNMCPEGAYIKNKHGNFPLYESVRSCNFDTSYILLQKTEFKGGLFDEREETDEKALPLWERRNTIWNKLQRNFSQDRIKAMLEGVERYPFLHDAIGSISVDGIQFIIDELQVNLDVVDSAGRNALLVAVMKACEHLSLSDENEKHWEDYFRPIIETMIAKICKQANDGKKASLTFIRPHLIDGAGRHLLHHATDLGLPWGGVECILRADIKALSTGDTNTGLLPFMLAVEGRRDSLTVAFELLRNQPDVMESL